MTHTHCELCQANLGDHTASRPYNEPYEVVICEGGESLCYSCWMIRHNIEPFISFEYKPHQVVWPAEVEMDEPIEDFETEELIEDIEEIAQLSLWGLEPL